MQSPSVVVFETQLDKALSDLACPHRWPCFEGPLEVPSSLEYPTTSMSSCLLFIPAVMVWLCTVARENVKGVIGVGEEHPVLTVCGGDGDLSGMRRPSAEAACSVRLLGFQENAIGLGCPLFRKALSGTTYRSGCLMTKSNSGAQPLPEKRVRFKIPLCSYE